MDVSIEQPVGECIPHGGAWQFQGLCRSLNGGLTGEKRKSRAKDDKISTWDLTDDIESIEASREDVEMGNDRDEEPLEAEVPRARMNPQSPTSPEKQEHEDSGHVVYRNWCAAFVEGRGVGGQH